MSSVIKKWVFKGIFLSISIGFTFFVSIPSFAATANQIPNETQNYANLSRAEIKKKLKPYAIPATHPMKSVLDQIFKGKRVTQDAQTFAAAGFKTIRIQPGSFIRVAKHPRLPGYLVKIYLDTEIRQKDNIPGWLWFIYRCQGAQQIQALIDKKKLRLFNVPKKYIYILPKNPSPPQTPQYTKHPAILLVEKKKISSFTQNAVAWKNKVNRHHLDELYCIFSHGYSSTYILNNIPYCKDGMFSCIDTEKPPRKHDLTKIGKYFNPEMRSYWNSLIQKGGNL